MALVKNSEVGQKPWSSQAGSSWHSNRTPHFLLYPLGLELKKTWWDLFPGTRRESGCGWTHLTPRGSGATSEHLPSQNALGEVGPLQAQQEGHPGWVRGVLFSR